MVETTAVPAARTTPTPLPAPKASASTTLSSDFNTFLKMLTTQLQNQDPLNPMDSAEFSMQLATFSGVEQQVKSNDLLTSLSAQFGVVGMAQLAGWVGKEARAAVPAFYDGDPITLHASVKPNADSATLVVKNAFGTEVDRRPIPLPVDTLTWSGLGADGTPRPSGSYAFSIESSAGSTPLDPSTPEVYNRIVEARLQDGATMLVLEGGALVPGSSIRALR